MHTVVTQEVGERGLEALEEYWVELSAYEKDPENPPVQASDYVYEYVDGVLKAGVSWFTNSIVFSKSPGTHSDSTMAFFLRVQVEQISEISECSLNGLVF